MAGTGMVHSTEEDGRSPTSHNSESPDVISNFLPEPGIQDPRTSEEWEMGASSLEGFWMQALGSEVDSGLVLAMGLRIRGSNHPTSISSNSRQPYGIQR